MTTATTTSSGAAKRTAKGTATPLIATVQGTRSGSVGGGGTSLTGAAKSAIMRSCERFWAPSDLPGAESTVQHLLAELTRQGELRRVRRGLYWRGTKTPLGMSPPSTTALVARLAPAKGSGPAGLSAANALRLSTQIPRRAQVAVPARAKRSTGAVEFVSRP